MKTAVWSLAVGLSLALIGWTGASRAAAQADDPQPQAVSAPPGTGVPPTHSHEKSELHGGQVTMTRGHHFETLFAPDGIRIFIYSTAQTPQMTEKAKGQVTLKFTDGSEKVLPLVVQRPAENEKSVSFCPMHMDVVQMNPGNCPKCGMKLSVQDYLFGKADLSQVKPGTLEAVVAIRGLPKPETEVTFTEADAIPAPESPEGQSESAPVSPVHGD